MIKENKIAIQDTYGDRFQYCWGCGPKNDEGLHLKSYPSADGLTVECRLIPHEKYTGGVPDNLFGGMIAMIFDCHGTASAAYFNHHSRGLKFDKDAVIDRYITPRLEIDFKNPFPMNEEILVISELEELTDRKASVKMTMQSSGLLRAAARIIAVRLTDDI